MALLRLALICAVLAVGLPACGDKLEPGDEELEWIKRTVPVRVLVADMLRGGSAELYPDGRALVGVMGLGGGTVWHGTWAEADERLTIRLHRQQDMMSDWSAPKSLDPPDELILVGSDSAGWMEERRTFVPFLRESLRWRLQGINRIPKVAIERDFHFQTEAEFWENGGGWEMVEDIEEQEEVREEPVEPKGGGK